MNKGYLKQLFFALASEFDLKQTFAPNTASNLHMNS